MKQNLLRKFRKTQSGQAIVEYIIIVALVAIAAITVCSVTASKKCLPVQPKNWAATRNRLKAPRTA